MSEGTMRDEDTYEIPEKRNIAIFLVALPATLEFR